MDSTIVLLNSRMIGELLYSLPLPLPLPLPFIPLLVCLEAMNSSSSLLGRSHSCAALKSIATKLLTLLCCRCCKSTNKYSTLDALLERKIVELRRQAFAPSSAHQRKQFRSINSVIMKFPLLKHQVQNLLAIFDHYDEDSNGTIDREELKKCFQELQVNLTDLEFDDLFHSCDLDGNGLIQFNEFIVFLCLIYLLTKPSSPTNMVSRIGLAHLEETFDTIIQVFLYMDKNGDGKLNKNDMISALTEAPWERSPSHVTNTRFIDTGHINCSGNGQGQGWECQFQRVSFRFN